jgi:transcriptional regulator with XRE-family HTH domain
MRIDVRALRLRLKITQTELARRLGVDQSTVSRLEKQGEVEGPLSILLGQMATERPRRERRSA